MHMNRFTKLNPTGAELPADATTFAAVRDTTTGLIWLAVCIAVDTQQQAEAKAAEQTFNGEPCRLPTIEELETIRDRSRAYPAHDPQFFSFIKTDDWCWSSTAFAGDADYAWSLLFGYGDSNAYGRDGGGYALAVRGGSPRQ
jgi:hypothetical protein